MTAIDITQTSPGSFNGNKPKVAFFDLDGTIVNAAGQITPASLAAISALRQHGIKVALATGRPLFGCNDPIKVLAIDQPSLFFSGSLIINPATNDVLFEAALSPQVIRPIIEMSYSLGLYCELYTKDNYFVETEDLQLAQMHYTYLKCYSEKANFASLMERERIIKMVIISETEEQAQKLRAISDAFPNLTFIISKGAAHPHIDFGNITSAEASRENGFDVLTRHFKAKSSEVISFGDAEADVPFMTRAGFGIALGNAPQHVKDVTKYSTSSVEEDGVALAVRKILSYT